MNGVSNTTRHGITSSLPRAGRSVFAGTRHGANRVPARILLLAIVTLSAFFVTTSTANATTYLPPTPVGLPNSIASTAPVVAGKGTPTAFGASSGTNTNASCKVTLLICTAAALEVGNRAVSVAWTWSSTHAVGDYDPAASQIWSPAGITVTSFTAAGNSASITFKPNSTIVLSSVLQLFHYNSTPSALSGYGTIPSGTTLTAGTSYTITSNSVATVAGAILEYGTSQAWAYYPPSGSPTLAAMESASGTSAGTTPTFTSGGSGTGTTTVTTTPTSSCYNGSATTSVAGTPITYTGSSTDPLPTMTFPACPSGYNLRAGVTTPSTTSTGTVATVMTWTAPTINSSTYPNCIATGTSSPCVLTLTKVDPSGTVVNCTNNLKCTGWNPAGESDGSTYTCKWGTYTLAASDCTTVPTEGTPAPVDNPGGSGTPDSGSDTEACYPTGWHSFNPLEWVYKPMKCLLSWAFIPPAGTSDEWQAQINGIKNSGAVTLAASGTSYVTSFITASENFNGCDSGAFGEHAVTGPDGSGAGVPEGFGICAISSKASNWATTTSWGGDFIILQKCIITIFFLMAWYNTITASFGSKSDL